ncbi:MAG: serine/threonine protein kinase [Planctomycetes bacterium]|nr:serine/threonine protein kinase [Planctomycetota bacterium]MBL7007991.1 serine/threonine protein kinase [Planctomycetota bacterium]
MERDRWERVKELFAEAEALPAEERGAFVAAASGEDDELREELLSLLDAHRGVAVRALDADAAAYFSGPLEPGAEGSLVGERAGPFQLERHLASGGMGEVYLGQRVDDFEQTVAVKVIRPGFDTGSLLQRFLSERQTLAGLEHRNIAKLVDGGRLANGSPWLAMEYIDGHPLTRWTEERDLDTAGRVRLFLQVCAGVDYAHRRLVVHRDLKPANVLVTADGTPKLLDFGIAKILDPEASAAGPELTVAPLLAMTPEYASPEQVRGETVTTASDVYSLGVMLYRLITGVQPYEFPTRAIRDIERTVCDDEPAPPSRVGELGRWAADLDAIVLMALRKEPERRYPSVGAFADDLSRCLDGLPVLARPASWRYRTGKFARRHRAGVAAAALVSAAAVAGLAGILWQAGIARGEAETSGRVAEAMISLFQEGDPWESDPGDTPVRVFLERNGAQALAGLEDDPRVQAELSAVLGEVYTRLEINDGARQLLEQALGRGVKPETEAEVLHWLGIVSRRQGDLAGAERLHRQELALSQRVRGRESREVVHALNALGTVFAKSPEGRWEEAESVWSEAMEIRERLFGPASAEVAESVGNLAFLRFSRGVAGREAGEEGAAQAHFDQAVQLFERAIAAYAAAYPAGHPDLATALNNLGMVKLRLDAADEARPLIQAALEMRLELLGEDHPHVAISWNNLGLILYQEGDFAGAAKAFGQALAIAEPRLGGSAAEVSQYRDNLAAAVADSQEEAGSTPEAAAGG